MQKVRPLVRILQSALGANIVRAHGHVIPVPGSIIRSLEVILGICVNVRHQLMDIEDGKVSSRPALGTTGFEIVEHHLVHGGDVIRHLLVVSVVIVGAFIRPEEAICHAALFGRLVHGCGVEDVEVEEDEATAASGVDEVVGRPDAVDKVGEGLACDLCVHEVSADAHVVGADPGCVDGVVSGGIGEEICLEVFDKLGDHVVEDGGDGDAVEGVADGHDLV